jgi:hypothetical protein
LEIYNDHPDEALFLNINKQITSIFDNKKERDNKETSAKFNPGTKTFKCIKRIFSSYIKINFPDDENIFTKNIVLYFNNFILNSPLNTDSSSLEFIIEEFDSYAKILKRSSQVQLLEEILNFIVNKKQYINIEVFFKNLSKILSFFDKDVQNKFVFNKLFSLIDSFNINNPLPPYEIQQAMLVVINNMEVILSILEKFENEEILLRLPSLLCKFDDFIHSSGLDWRKNVAFIKSLRM